MLVDSGYWTLIRIPCSCTYIQAVSMTDRRSNDTDNCLCILQYEHLSRDHECLASVVFEFLTVLKWKTLPILNTKELVMWRRELLWSHQDMYTSMFFFVSIVTSRFEFVIAFKSPVIIFMADNNDDDD